MTTEPLIIDYARQSDGATYALNPLSLERIKKAFPDKTPTSHTVFVSYDTKDNFEAQHGPIWRQIALIVTGLTEDEIEELGGLQLVDPVSRKPLAAPI